MIFSGNHRVLFIFCLFFNVGQNRVLIDYLEPTSSKSKHLIHPSEKITRFYRVHEERLTFGLQPLLSREQQRNYHIVSLFCHKVKQF